MQHSTVVIMLTTALCMFPPPPSTPVYSCFFSTSLSASASAPASASPVPSPSTFSFGSSVVSRTGAMSGGGVGVGVGDVRPCAVLASVSPALTAAPGPRQRRVGVGSSSTRSRVCTRDEGRIRWSPASSATDERTRPCCWPPTWFGGEGITVTLPATIVLCIKCGIK